MMHTRLFTSLYAGLFIYLLTIYFFGSTGRFAYGELEKQRLSLEKNVEGLETQGENLRYAMDALQTDPDKVVREGRRLLLLREREGIVRIVGYKERSRPISPGGLVMRRNEVSRGTEPLLRAFSVAAGILVFLFYGLVGKRKKP